MSADGRVRGIPAIASAAEEGVEVAGQGFGVGAYAVI
jgi:hypothetical protein